MRIETAQELVNHEVKICGDKICTQHTSFICFSNLFGGGNTYALYLQRDFIFGLLSAGAYLYSVGDIMGVYIFKKEYKYIMGVPIYITVPILFIICIPPLMDFLVYGYVGYRAFKFFIFFTGGLVLGDILSYIYVALRFPYDIIIKDCRIVVRNRFHKIILERHIRDISSVSVFPNRKDNKGYVRIDIYKRLKPIAIGNKLLGGGMSDLGKLQRLLNDIKKSKVICIKK